jgi:Holliday junction resolvase RusA-like endonuclease
MLNESQIPLAGFEEDNLELFFDIVPYPKGRPKAYVMNGKSFEKARTIIQGCLSVSKSKRYMRKVRETLNAFQLGGVILRVYDLLIKPPMVRMYTPKKTEEYEKELAWLARSKYRGKPLEGPIKISVEFFFKPPDSWSKTKTSDALCGVLKHTSRPDLDNLLKSLEDALNGIVWVDDSQIYSYSHVSKEYADRPGIKLKVRW